MNPAFGQQVPNFAVNDGQKRFMGQPPLNGCCCCLNVALCTGCKILAFISLISGFYYAVTFLAYLDGPLYFYQLMTGVYAIWELAISYYGLKACGELKVEYAERFYKLNLYMLIFAVVSMGLSAMIACSDTSDQTGELICGAVVASIWFSIFFILPFSLYFLWVSWSFYVRLQMGQMELVLHGPAFESIVARNALVASQQSIAQNQMATPVIAQGVQMHAVQFQSVPQGHFQNQPQGHFQNQPQGHFQNQPQGHFQNQPQGHFQNQPQGNFHQGGQFNNPGEDTPQF